MLTRTPVTQLVFGIFLVAVTLGAAPACDRASATSSSSSSSSSLDGPPVPWAPADVVDAAAVAKQLGAANAMVVVHVGPEVLFKRGHVPGALYGGEAGTDDGLAQLEATARTLPKDRDIVLYCGCCPRSDCPNIRPAFKTLAAKGFHVKVLDMPTNFRTDWANKGFSVDKG